MDLEEILHILVSVITISLAFSLFKSGEMFSASYFFAILFTVGTAFTLHELAHKYTAMHYGVRAVYRAWTSGLVFALVLAFLTQGRFVFAAPGAVYILGRVTNEQNGKIALAGPAMNFVLILVFIGLAFALPGLREIALLGAYINAFLGGFNMIPFGPLDGRKIAAWSRRAWSALFIAFLIAFFSIPMLA